MSSCSSVMLNVQGTRKIHCQPSWSQSHIMGFSEVIEPKHIAQNTERYLKTKHQNMGISQWYQYFLIKKKNLNTLFQIIMNKKFQWHFISWKKKTVNGYLVNLHHQDRGHEGLTEIWSYHQKHFKGSIFIIAWGPLFDCMLFGGSLIACVELLLEFLLCELPPILLLEDSLKFLNFYARSSPFLTV